MTEFERIQKIIVDHFAVDPVAVKSESLLADELGIDSLDMCELEMAIEDEFNIPLPNADGWETVSDIEASVKSAVADQQMQEGAGA